MSRFYKEDCLNLKINPILKLKFHIAIWFQGMSATITSFISDYVRDYEKQYGIIPITLTNDIKYDILTKFFGVQLDRQTYKKLNHQSILNLVNETLWVNLNIDEFSEILKIYPKTRNWCNISESWTLELLEKNKDILKNKDLQGYWLGV